MAACSAFVVPTADRNPPAYGPGAGGMFIDLLPIPAAIVVLDDGALAFEAVNRSFRQAGLGATAAQSPLVRLLDSEIRDFLASDDLRRQVPWRLGDAVHSQFFTVMLARRSISRAGLRCMVTLVDRTAAERTEHSLKREMNSDSLTGLPNRAGFGDLTDAAIEAAGPARYAVLAVNLDRFSRINACMGALTGDEVLISVARRLKGILRGRDVLARTGGDEFAILLHTSAGADDAAQVADRIRVALSTPFRLSDFEVQVECSIGIALGADAGDDADDLIRHAQFAVKRAKRSGRTETYQTHALDLVRNQFSIETELRRALDAGELTLNFQPICDLSTGRVRSFEALARWPQADGTMLSPCTFIPVAEESGLIVPLGRWAMDEAARTLAAWDIAAGGDCGVKMAVNLSAVQLHRDAVPQMVAEVLSRHRLAGSRFTLELTESAIVSDPERATRTLCALKEQGTTLAMDDFGTGYSNLAYLQKLPIDKLKIDRSFVTGMLADRDKVAIVRAILSLAQALGMRTTAEGVETHELEQTLSALGCTFGQGFLYAPGLAQDAAYQLLVDRNE